MKKLIAGFFLILVLVSSCTVEYECKGDCGRSCKTAQLPTYGTCDHG